MGNSLAKILPIDDNIQVARGPSQPLDVLDVSRFQQMSAIAEAMATASLVPEHLKVYSDNKKTAVDEKKTAANCFLVVNQSVRWGLDPFAVMGGSYVIGGKLAWEGKVIAAVVNSRAGLQERLAFEYEGEGQGRRVTVSGTFHGESLVRQLSGTVGEWSTNNQMWKKGGVTTDQKLAYTSVIWWARRFVPELVLGVLMEGEELTNRTNDGHATVSAESQGRPLLASDIASAPAASGPAKKNGAMNPAKVDELKAIAATCGTSMKAAFKRMGWPLPDQAGQLLESEFSSIEKAIRVTGAQEGGCKGCGEWKTENGGEWCTETHCSPECEEIGQLGDLT